MKLPTTTTNLKSSNLSYLALDGCLCSNFIFCSTGVFQVIIVQWLDYHGLNGGKTGLTVLSSYLGLLLFAVPFTFSNRDDDKSRYHPMFTVCIVSDVLSNVCNQLSITLCGSMLFMIIYSSIIIFSAFLRWKVYGMGVTLQQTKALIVITVGLLITAFDGFETDSNFLKSSPGNGTMNRRMLPSTMVTDSSGLAKSYLTKSGRVPYTLPPFPSDSPINSTVCLPVKDQKLFKNTHVSVQSRIYHNKAPSCFRRTWE